MFVRGNRAEAPVKSRPGLHQPGEPSGGGMPPQIKRSASNSRFKYA